jgi:lysozyme
MAFGFGFGQGLGALGTGVVEGLGAYEDIRAKRAREQYLLQQYGSQQGIFDFLRELEGGGAPGAGGAPPAPPRDVTTEPDATTGVAGTEAAPMGAAPPPGPYAPTSGAPATGSPAGPPMEPSEAPAGPTQMAGGEPLPIADPYRQAIKGFEGYQPRASWDYRQYTGGYGSRAAYPGQYFSPEQAEAGLTRDLATAAGLVDRRFPDLPEGPRAALVSLTQNAGTSWMDAGLGRDVDAGDWQSAENRLAQYVRAGGRIQPGLVRRRGEERTWMAGGEPSAGTAYAQAAPGEGAVMQAGARPPGYGTDAQGLPGNMYSLPELAQRVEQFCRGRNCSGSQKYQILMGAYKMLSDQGKMQFSQWEKMYRDQIMSERADIMKEKYQAIKDQAKEQGDMIMAHELNPMLPGLYGERRAAVQTYLHQQGFNLAKAQQEWTASMAYARAINNPQAVRFNQMGTSVLNSLATIKRVSRDLDQGGFKWANEADLAYWATAEQDSKRGILAREFMTAIGMIQGEIAQVESGGYAPQGHGWDVAKGLIQPGFSHKGMDAALDTIQQMLSYRINAVTQVHPQLPGGARSPYEWTGPGAVQGYPAGAEGAPGAAPPGAAPPGAAPGATTGAGGPPPPPGGGRAVTNWQDAKPGDFYWNPIKRYWLKRKATGGGDTEAGWEKVGY